MEFKLVTDVLDYGEQVTAIVVENVNKLTNINIADVCVSCRNIRHDGVVHYEGSRTVNELFFTNDLETLKHEPCGDYMILLLEYGFEKKAADAIYYNIVMEDGSWNFFKSYNLQLQLNYKLSIKDVEYNQIGIIRSKTDCFSYEVSKKGIKYRKFIPTIRSEKYPLIIWFHGSGEGGIDNESQIVANKGAVAFASKKAQAIFNGAYVVAPQTPTNWAATKEDLAKISIPLPKSMVASKDYVPDIHEMIDEIIAIHDDIDTSKIYIIGCSAGGAMTWKTLISNPSRFAAAVPICGPKMTPSQLDLVTDIPIWLVHSRDDETVAVSNSIDNYEYLNNEHTHITLYDDVTIDGQNYNGHWSWVYALNNKPTLEDGTSLFEWMARQGGDRK